MNPPQPLSPLLRLPPRHSLWPVGQLLWLCTPLCTLPDSMLHLMHSLTHLCSLLDHIVPFTHICVITPVGYVAWVGKVAQVCMRVLHRLRRLYGSAVQARMPHKSCCMAQEGSGHMAWVGKVEHDIWEVLQELGRMHKGTWGCRYPVQFRVVHGGTAWVEKQRYIRSALLVEESAQGCAAVFKGCTEAES